MTNAHHPLVRLALDGNFKTFEEAWIQAVTAGQRELEAYFEAADRTVASGRGDVAGPLLGMLLEQLAKDAVHDEILNFAERCVLLCITDKSVRGHAATIHKKAGRPELPALVAPLDASNNESARTLVSKCLRLKPGTFVTGTVRIGPERIVRFDTDALLFWLTDGESEREITPEAAAHELTILSADDFRALLRFEVNHLIDLAERDPVALVASALRAHKNRLEWQALKKLLARGVVDPTAFARWWNKAKGLVERNPMIQVYGDRQPILILRERPITHEEELAAKIKTLKTDLEKFDLVVSYVDSIAKGHAKDEVFLAQLGDMLSDIADSPATRAPVAIAAASLLDDLRKHAPSAGRDIDPAALAARAKDMSDLATLLNSEDLCRRVLEFVRTRMTENWATIFAKTLPTAPGRLPDYIAKELLTNGKGDELASAISAILQSPDRYGEGLLWLWKAATSKALDKAPCRIDKVAITIALFRTMNRWMRGARTQVSAAQRALVTRMRNAVVASNYKVILSVFEGITGVQALQVYSVLKDNLGFTDAQRHKLMEELKHDHKDAILGKKELWEEDVIYTSPRGLRIREEEFNKIVNIDMVNNSAAIGEAAGFGDLSENAEFTAALEKRDFLAARANDIGEELKKALLIPDDIKTTTVNVGCTIRVKNVANGELETITFLGPWDANLEQRIYSYLAPFARNFLGKKVGDIAEDGDKRYEILAIDRAQIPV
jgi:transcription elongation factor GreA